MPQKSYGSFLNFSSFISGGMISYGGYGFWRFFSWFSWDVPDVTVLIVLFAYAVFGGLGFVMLIDNFGVCWYCKQGIYNFQRRITVRWEEAVRHSGKIVSVSEMMHTSCHNAAVEKFKIPVPEYSSFEV